MTRYNITTNTKTSSNIIFLEMKLLAGFNINEANQVLKICLGFQMNGQTFAFVKIDLPLSEQMLAS